MPTEYQFVDFLFGGLMTLQGDGDPYFVEPRTYRAAYTDTQHGVVISAIHRRGESGNWIPDQLPADAHDRLCELIERDIARRHNSRNAPAIEGDALKRLADR